MLLPAEKQVALWANADAMEARRTLRAMQTAGVSVTAEQVFELTLLATGNHAAAERSFKDHRHAELRAGIRPR